MYGCDIIHVTSTYLLGDIYLSLSTDQCLKGPTHELKGVTYRYMSLGDYIFVHLFFFYRPKLLPAISGGDCRKSAGPFGLR